MTDEEKVTLANIDKKLDSFITKIDTVLYDNKLRQQIT